MNPRTLIFIFFMAVPVSTYAQTDSLRTNVGFTNSLRVEVTPASSEDFTILSEKAADFRGRGMEWAPIRDAMKYSAVSSVIDLGINTAYNAIVKKRQEKKRQWQQMVRNECSYTDSVTSVLGSTDFYKGCSSRGPFDPDSLNFNEIIVTDSRDGEEFLYIRCKLRRDEEGLTHLFLHSKFYLEVEEVVFDASLCHLPNFQANGLCVNDDLKRKLGDSRCEFNYDDRGNLAVTMDITFMSSWINEAAMVMSDVKLGSFSLKFNIPDGEYKYVYETGQKESDSKPEISGESFIVPRSFMPLNSGERMWGTGEYRMTVRIKESCESRWLTKDELKKQRKALKEDVHDGKKGAEQKLAEFDGEHAEAFDWKGDYDALSSAMEDSRFIARVFTWLGSDSMTSMYKTTVTAGINTLASQLDLEQSTGEML